MTRKKLLNFDTFNYIFNGIFIVDKNQKVVFWNKTMKDWTGYDLEDVYAKKLDEIFPSFIQFIYQHQINTVLKFGTTAIFSSHLHRNLYAGEKKIDRYLHTTVNFLPMEDSQEPYAIFCIEDQTQLTELILESKRNQDKLIAKEEQLRNANLVLEERVLERTADLVTANSALKKEIEKRSKNARQLKESREKLSRQNIELSHLNLKLTEINNQLNQTNEELNKSKIKAEESDQLKSAFLANMSHEIRTPMNSILGFSELLQDEGLSEDMRRVYLNMVLKSGKQLLALINDVLDISKIESGQIVITKKLFVIEHILEEIMQTFKPEVENKSLTFHIYNELPDKFEASIDYVRTKQVLSNFISNAIKFTDIGSIEIRTKLKDQMLYFHVKDTGIGIPKEFHHKVFKRFHQANQDLVKLYGGTGLGLAISKNLAQLMGGEVFMESEPGIGSTFGMQLPIK
ncbi:ATP-binding protein [uncultured Sunxiuqinia sp.]|uniref:ATP-binding protein n=1 Tax=uncultured Sunxiuqinia sp. TaxID=1573825 RepID=UPI002AA95A16|nr:ATP-binding protein [uncultured Sunxiuqinia sp.]